MILQYWKNASIAIQGKDHIGKNIPCQDKVYTKYENGIYVIALADGAGSKKMSEKGAQLVVKTICDYLCLNFYDLYMLCENVGKDQQVHQRELEKAKSKIKEQIVNSIMFNLDNSYNLDDYASTLLFFAFDNNKYISGHVGDGVIGVLDNHSDYKLKVLSKPENAGAPNITYFITDNNSLDHLRLSWGSINEINGVVLMSDGPEEVLYYNREQDFHPNTLKILTNFHSINNEKYSNILKTFLEVNIAKYSYDDLSLNVLYLDTIDTLNIENEVLSDLADMVKSKQQFIKMSSYSYFVRGLLPTDSIDFTDKRDGLSYIEGLD